jgi:hypothetical protein
VPAGRAVAPGDPFSPSELSRIEWGIRNAETLSGLAFSVYVGASEEDPRRYAIRLHAALNDPAGSVLVMCDPAFRALEVISGSRAKRTLDDIECGLAVASMQSSFVAGDLVGGLVLGIQQLGEAARSPRTLHSTST